RLANKAADRRACTIAGDHIVGVQVVSAIRRLDIEERAIEPGFDSDDLVAPAELDIREALCVLVEKALAIVLLQIDERGPMVTGLRQQIEGVDEVIAEIDLADVPRHALLHHPLAAAQPVPDLERPFGEADGA